MCAAHEEWGASFQALHPQLSPLGLADVDCAVGRPLVVRSLLLPRLRCCRACRETPALLTCWAACALCTVQLVPAGPP